MMALTCNLSTQEVEIGGSKVKILTQKSHTYTHTKPEKLKLHTLIWHSVLF
jgi:hypothetical protein